MATLSDVATNVTGMIRRSDLEAEAKAEIGNAIRHYSRRNSWVIERRGASITTVVGQTYYTTVDNTTGVGLESSPVGTTPTSTDSLKDIIDIVYAKLEIGAIDWPLTLVSYRRFETLLENTTVSGTPNYITHYAGQIGLWPAPDQAFTVYISAMFKPAVPTVDADESVWFDQYQELIENSAARRLGQKWMQDPEMAQLFSAAEQEQEHLLLAEGMRRQGVGRLTPTID